MTTEAEALETLKAAQAENRQLRVLLATADEIAALQSIYAAAAEHVARGLNAPTPAAEQELATVRACIRRLSAAVQLGVSLRDPVLSALDAAEKYRPDRDYHLDRANRAEARAEKAEREESRWFHAFSVQNNDLQKALEVRDDLRAALEKAERERDEARAEVKRLQEAMPGQHITSKIAHWAMSHIDTDDVDAWIASLDAARGGAK